MSSHVKLLHSSVDIHVCAPLLNLFLVQHLLLVDKFILLILVRVRFLGIRQFPLLPKTTSLLGIKRRPQGKKQRQLQRKLRRKVQKRILSAMLVS
jgi:hypothetical protein